MSRPFPFLLTFLSQLPLDDSPRMLFNRAPNLFADDSPLDGGIFNLFESLALGVTVLRLRSEMKLLTRNCW